MVAISGSGGRSSWERRVYFAETSPAENASQVSVGPIARERSPSFYCTSPKIPYHLSQNHIEPLPEVVLRYGPESCAGTKTPPKCSRTAIQATFGHKNTPETFPHGHRTHNAGGLDRPDQQPYPVCCEGADPGNENGI